MKFISKKWVFLALKLFAVPAVCVGVLIFLSGKITAAADRISKVRSDAATFAKRYESLDRMKNEWERVSPQLEKLERAIPPPNEFPVIKGYIESSMVKTSNSGSSRFDDLPHVGDLLLFELSFTMNVSGTYASIQQLLRELETAPYFIEIKTLGFIFPTGMNGQANATLTGIVYLKDTPL